MRSQPLVISPSSKYPIGYIEIRVFGHATEDLEKVEAAVRNLLPQEFATDAAFAKTNCVGHYGNPIVLIGTKLENRQLLPKVLEKIGSSLSSLDKVQLSDGFKEHLEKHSLFLRFDKQSAFLGALRFSVSDPIRVKIHFRNKSTDEIAELCRQAGLLP